MALDGSTKDDIDLLLENSEYEQGFVITIDDHIIHTNGQPLEMVYDSSGHSKALQSQATDIGKLYYQQNKANQIAIIELLLSKLSVGGAVTGTVVSSLFQTGNIKLFIDHAIKQFKQNDFHPVADSLIRLNYLLAYSWQSFNKDEVRKIRAWAKDTLEQNNELGQDIVPYSDPGSLEAEHLFHSILKQTNKILIKDVRQRIELGFNPEINQDEQLIKEEFGKFGFPNDLSEALNKIDQKLTASQDDFDFKGTMDLLRSFTERLYRSILDQYGDEGRKVREQDSEDVVKFFVKQGLVNGDFGKMIANQRHFISNTASHRLKSREEDARLSKNMVIEMSLYLLRRLQNN